MDEGFRVLGYEGSRVSTPYGSAGNCKDKMIVWPLTAIFVSSLFAHSLDQVSAGAIESYKMRDIRLSNQPHIETGGTYRDTGPAINNLVVTSVSGTASAILTPNY